VHALRQARDERADAFQAQVAKKKASDQQTA
jgi:hypothetical protein